MVEPIPFGNYYLLERVNVGGMAEIFKAKSFGVEGFSRILAVKRILPNMAEDEEFINMFIDEAKISVQLNHANVVQIYELGCFDGSYYIAMEYVPGRDLRQLLDRYRKAKALMPLPQAAYIASKICDGLDYAHRKTDDTGKPLNIIHRDVSPQNIMISYEGAVKVLDFGIAKAEDRASKTQAGVLKGKFGYMSPEQVSGQTIDHRSDIFAVGVIFYEMVTGKRLFVGESDFSTLDKVRKAEVIPPSQVNPNVTPELEAVIMKALAKNRDERYQWASDFSEDLQQFLIADNSVYTAKKLSTMLKDTYQEDIEAEAAKMEEYAKITDPPPDASKEIRSSHGAKDEEEEEEDIGAQKTVIFTSADVEAMMKGQMPGAASSSAPAPAKKSPSKPKQQPRQPEAPLDLSSMPTGVITAPMMNQLTNGGSMVAPNMMGGYNSGQFYPNTTANFQYPPMQQQQSNRTAMSLLIGLGSVVMLALIGFVFFLLFDDSSGSGNGLTTLTITTSPSEAVVSVWIDDQKVSDRTPFTKQDLTVGAHVITLKSPGYKDAVFKATAAAGQPLPLAHTLEPDTSKGALGGSTVESGKNDQATSGSISVISKPEGAAIYIDKINQGTTPATINNLRPGTYVKIQVTKEGYTRAEKSVKVPTNGSIPEIAFDLEKIVIKPSKSASKPAQKSPAKAKAPVGICTLKINTPGIPGTEIYYNGKKKGTVPQMSLEVPAGKFTITLKNGAKQKDIKIECDNGDSRKIIEKEL